MPIALELPAHASITPIEGKIFVPEGALDVPGFDPRTIMPDEVAADIAERYGFIKEGRIGVDLMAGVATVSRVHRKLGGHCLAVEQNPDLCEVIRKALPDIDLTEGDCNDYEPPHPLDHGHLSPSFLASLEGSLGELAKTLIRVLKPGAIVVIDSDDFTKRRGPREPLAPRQIDYFTSHGLLFERTHRYVVEHPASGVPQDTGFTEIVLRTPS
jgi:hypothetical protein